ncbi:MAG: hypothetical protein HC856_07520, partial [Pseudanabaena sp. RU_4_16]|nr:hypothetical protein [Pseudanabaena sp. RU_4_16]
MPESDPTSIDTEALDTEALIVSLLHKEGTWVQWGNACQKLQKLDSIPRLFFEQTGFEPIHQNQLIVAAQVYEGLGKGNASGYVLEYFEARGSDILYEFRILPQAERVNAAELVANNKLDVFTAKDIAKALKEFAVMPTMPVSRDAVVTTVMPVAKDPSARRNSRASIIVSAACPSNETGARSGGAAGADCLRENSQARNGHSNAGR